MVFIESRAFTRRLHELAGQRWAEVLGGIRKARAADPVRGKGKRGGFRYLYLEVPARAHIHLLYLFGKNEQEDLDPEQRAVLRKMAEQVREQG